MGCNDMCNCGDQWAILDQFCTHPIEGTSAIGVKLQPEFMFQQNPMDGIYGIGGEKPAGIHKHINAFHRIVPELTDLLAIPGRNL